MSLTPPGQSRRPAIALAGLVTAAAIVASAVVGAPTATAAPSRLAATGQAAPVVTTTTLTTSRNPAYTAQPGGLTAKVKGTWALGVPTGSVDFYVDGQLWWTEPLDATGRARLTFLNLGPGAHSVVAAYGGDPNYAPSTSAALSQTVLPTAPTTVLSYTPSTVAPGAVSRLVVAATNQTPVYLSLIHI